MSVSLLGRWLDRFRGSGDAAVTVPSMDGALRPNRLLDEAETLFSADGIANLVGNGASAYFSAGSAVYRLTDLSSQPSIEIQLQQDVSALATHSSGGLAIGLSGDGVLVRRPGMSDLILKQTAGRNLNCPTGLAFADANTLIVCNGSASNTPGDWRRDLMERRRSGSVWRVDLTSGDSRLHADGLGFPTGVHVSGDGRILVSESWRHRIVRIDEKTPESLLDDLPGYPGDISSAADGGFWLSVFAPRRQLIEFVLREDEYRQRMMATLPQEFWIAPALNFGRSYLEPVQSGGVRQLGILKPWAPTRSYGLLVRLDRQMNPTTSYHSRADGNRHGITSSIEFGTRILATSTGAGLLLAVDPTRVDE